MKVLITGANGQLGRCLQTKLREAEIEFLACSARDLDITDKRQIRKKFDSYQPTAIINCAAFTNVEEAETEIESAFKVNSEGPKLIAEVCSEMNVFLIHISTDYVFDGSTREPLEPDDPVNPISEYGKSKLAGELAIQSTAAKSIIIRTSWLFSEYGKNFFTTMIRLFNERQKIAVVSDEFGAPTYAGDLAEVCLGLLSKVERANDLKASTVLHYAGNEECTWFDFAKVIYSEAKALGLLNKNVEIKPILAKDYNSSVKRPSYSVLSSQMIESELGVRASAWKEQIKQLLLRDSQPT